MRQSRLYELYKKWSPFLTKNNLQESANACTIDSNTPSIYNRRHDETNFEDILSDRAAMISIQKEIVQKKIELVTSFMLHYKNGRNKDPSQRDYNDFL